MIDADAFGVRLRWLVLVGTLLSYLASEMLRKTNLVLWWTLTLALLVRFFCKRLLMFYISFELAIVPILLMVLF